MPTVRVIISSEAGTILEDFIVAPSEAVLKQNQPQNDTKLAEAVKDVIGFKFEIAET